MELMIERKYRQTDVGAIPEDWNLITYGEAFDFLKTATYSREQLTTQDEIGYVHYGDIHTKWQYRLDFCCAELPSVSADKARGYALLKEGDVVMADASEDTDGVGTSVEVMNIGARKVISGLHTFLLRDKIGTFADGYRAYIYKNAAVRKQFYNLATGMKVYGVSRTNLKKVLVPYPPTKEEQTAIATALSDAYALIAGLEKLIEKKRLIKQGAMQELLRPKDGWEVKKLGDYVKFQVGYPFESENFTTEEQGLRLIKNRDLKADDTIVHYVGSYPETHIVFNGDVLIGMDGDFIPCLWCKGKALLNQRVGRLLPTNKVSLAFLYYYLQKPLREIENRTSSTTVKHLSHGDIESIEVPFPDFDKQAEIAEILLAMDTEIVALERKLAKQKEIKQGMMQVLLTGKVRLV